MSAPEKKNLKESQRLPNGRAAPLPDASQADLQRKETATEPESQRLTRKAKLQSLEEQLLEVQIEEGHAEVARRRSESESLDAARFRSNVLLILLILLIILVVALALVNPALPEAVGVALSSIPK